ncbi:hypothetical protein MCOR27_006988, partial [Pyricularia oryzae]
TVRAPVPIQGPSVLLETVENNFDDKAGGKWICNWSERCTWVTHVNLYETPSRESATERFATLYLR